MWAVCRIQGRWLSYPRVHCGAFELDLVQGEEIILESIDYEAVSGDSKEVHVGTNKSSATVRQKACQRVIQYEQKHHKSDGVINPAQQF